MKNIKSKVLTIVSLLVMAVMTASAQPNNGGQAKQQSPEQKAKAKVERFTKELKLDDRQQKAIFEISLEMFKELEKQQKEPKPNVEQMRKAREMESTKIKKALKGNQLEKYDEMMERAKEAAKKQQKK